MLVKLILVIGLKPRVTEALGCVCQGENISDPSLRGYVSSPINHKVCGLNFEAPVSGRPEPAVAVVDPVLDFPPAIRAEPVRDNFVLNGEKIHPSMIGELPEGIMPFVKK